MNGPLNQVVVDLEALRHNYHVLRTLLPQKDTQIIAIVKSDAYGHGMLEVANALRDLPGLWGFGVAEVWEADLLREHGIAKPILLISGVGSREEGERAVAQGYVIGITCMEDAVRIHEVAEGLGRNAHCHLKIDTGMTRFGLDPKEAHQLIAKREHVLGRLILEGLYSHMACSDQRDSQLNQRQIYEFKSFLKEASRVGWRPQVVHLLNSSGIFNFPEAHFSAVRPGIALYGAIGCGGGAPSPSILRPVMKVSTKIRMLRPVSKGNIVGYGSTWRAERDSLLAIIPMGYDDGLMRSLSNRGHVLVGGRRAPVVGRVSMRSTVIDVTGCPGVRSGDEVVIIGTQGRESISAVELAESAGTISYELLCLMGTRNPRRFLGPQGA